MFKKTAAAVACAALGAIKYQGKVQKIKYNTGCGIVNVGTAATFNVPKDEWHFRHTKVA